jgi:hypothetical protein
MFQPPSTFFRQLLYIVAVQAVPVRLPHWLEPLVPHKGATLADELKCYSLPYGGIGFVSHLLTYWTALWLGYARKPYWPCSRLGASSFDFVLVGIQTVLTIGVTAFTMSRCRHRWQFVLIAVWKLALSLQLSVIGVIACLKAKAQNEPMHPWSRMFHGTAWMLHDSERTPTQRTPPRAESISVRYELRARVKHRNTISFSVYAIGTCIGLTGLVSIVKQNSNDPRIWIPTAVMLGVAAAWIFACITLFFFLYREWYMIKAAGTLAMIMTTLWSDWVLAAIANNLVGVPSGDNAVLFWVRVCNSAVVPRHLRASQIYFGAKRLPTFLS